MNTDNLTAALVEAFANADNGQVILETICFKHSKLATDRYFVRAKEDKTLAVPNGIGGFVDVLHTAHSFSLVRPTSNDSGVQDVTLEFDNTDLVGSEIVQLINTENEDTGGDGEPLHKLDLATVSYNVYLEELKDPVSGMVLPQMSAPITMFIASTQFNKSNVSFTLNFLDLVNRSFCHQNYTTLRFPGMFDYAT